MSTCRWCTPGGSVTTELLKKYAAKELHGEDLFGANDDLSYCMQCVLEYHRVRDELPQLHKALWKLETSRLVAQLEKSMREEIEEDDELFLVEEDGERQLFGFTGPNFESNLRVPLLEILKYPYLLLDQRVSELCTEALCKMEQVNNPFQVYDKLPGVYLLLVHPNETIRRWAILAARAQGKVDRDDYYDLQEVFTCLFKVIELGLFENPDIYGYTELEEGKLILLPSHLYDTTNYKNYWLGICMLLTVLEEQAMDSLLLGLDKQNDFMQSILHIMEKNTEDESNNPFWPALHCFMMILDRLGSKVWGQLIDPIQAFQTIIASPSYNSEIENIRDSFGRPRKNETDIDEDLPCSQIVYSFNTEKIKKDTGWKSAICPDYCPNMYEEIQSLANVLQSDLGQDTRVHNSAFLWFVPYVQSVMDLKDLGMAYIVEVIHHLYSEIKDVLNPRSQQCDKVAEIFILVLVSIIELHRNKKCLHLLWVSSHKWVEVLVKCSLLPVKDLQLRNNPKPYTGITSSPTLQTATSVQQACIQLIRSLLREGCQLGQQATCKPYLDKLNLIIRANISRTLELSNTEIQGLQACLRQIIKSVKDKASTIPSSTAVQSTSKTESVPFIKIERVDDDDDDWYGASSPSPLPCIDIKLGTAVSSPECVEGICWPTVKRELQEEGNCGLKLSSPCEPGCSTASRTEIKKEFSVKSEDVCSAQSEDNSSAKQNLKPKKQLIGWQSKLSKVMEKSSSLKFKRNSVSESKMNTNRNEMEIINESKTLPTSNIKIKTEQHDPFFKPFLCTDNSSDKSEGSDSGDDADVPLPNIQACLKEKETVLNPDNVQVTKQLERLSLENNCPGLKPVFKYTDSPFGEKHLLGKTNSVQNVCEDPSDNTEHNQLNLKGDCCGVNIANDADDDLPLTQLRKKLLKRKQNREALTNSQVDRDLDGLSLLAQAKCSSFPVDSSQESIASQEFGQIERKVKGTARSLVSDGLSSEIITISDSSEEEETKQSVTSVKCEEYEMNKNNRLSTSDSDLLKPHSEIKIKSETATPKCEEYDSQFFEFETDDQVFSVWEDSQVDQETPIHSLEEKKTSDPETKKLESTDHDSCNDFNQWGYDTDYVPDDVIEEAAEAAEEQMKRSTPGSSLQREKKDKCMNDNSGDSTSKDGVSPYLFYGKDAQVSNKGINHAEKSRLQTTPKKSHLSSKMTVSKKIETIPAHKIVSKRKANRVKSPLRSHVGHKLKESPIKGPLVVPPKKVRQCPEPTTTVEKLGLKKAPRKAFDLSQRSLDSLAELRSYGKSAGFVESKRQKTKLVSPQLLLVKGNKKLLACQDLQFYRQSKQKISGKGKQAENCEKDYRRAETSAKLRDENGTSSMHGKNKNTMTGLERRPSTSQTEENHLTTHETNEISSAISTNPNLTACISPEEEKTSCTKISVQLSSAIQQDDDPSPLSASAKEESKDSGEDTDDDNLFLTQADPVDMEICSQLDFDVEVGMPGGSDALKMDDSSTSHIESGTPKCRYTDCNEAVKNLGDHCPKHTPPEKVDDHLFAKPGLPLSLQKPSKPSTAKIFSHTNTSRTASLTKDLENIPKIQGAPRAKSLPPKPPVPRLTIPQPVQNRAATPPNTSGVLQPLINQNNIPSRASSAVGSGKSIQNPAAKSHPQRDQSLVMREVLHWKYEMFDNASQFGPPSNLCQLPLMRVPIKFSGYDEYFNAFYPLMLLNTFESLVQEWSVKQKVINSHLCKLHLQNFCPDSQVNRGDFQAWFRDADLNQQRHPKEDDLVFLLTPDPSNNLQGEETESQIPVVFHTGHVSRFTRSQRTQNLEKEQYTLCDLCIHTYGNLSACRNQQVQCIVIGSLITTQRQFKALLQLQRNPLFKSIIHPSPTDFLPRDYVTDEISTSPSLKDYNTDQKYAIEKAYAMVKQHPRLPRICLIHGPPGTGKSKTIVGLLYRILMEKKNSNVPDQNLNAKNKRNRVLVCAPSNAALDDLMKKIILEFKEKCHDKKNTLGNCGDINLVRLGAEKTISNDVVKFSLDCQVNYRINRAQQDQSIHKQKEALDRQLDELSRLRAMERCNKNTCVQLDERISRLSKERQLLANALKELRRRPGEVQRNIILESHVICCTLSTSGGFLLESAFRQLGQEPFSCVIVDEAGQSCEVESLIPLLHRCSKLVLVGDPEQLPPTVISVRAEELGYGQSLMSRLCRHLESTGMKSPVLQLTVQYRMHPDICLFPSHYFYKRMLKTDRATEEVRCSSDWPFQPYMVFDVADGYEKKERESFCNPQEIKVALALIKLIKSKKKEFCFRNIGVITPYRAQKMMIMDELRKAFGNEMRPGEVDTVDGFQGRQKDCIIVTCVRANTSQGNIGFLASRQRLNVTITRAKFSLFILGSLRTLMENKDWNNLIQDAQRRGALIKTKEEQYQKDVSRILKYKPVVQRTPFLPNIRTEERRRDNFSIGPRTEAPRDTNPPPRKAASSRPVVHPAVDGRRDALNSVPSSSVAAAVPPIPRGRQRDPRLARRQEARIDTNPSSAVQHQPTLGCGQNAGLQRPSSAHHSVAKESQQPSRRDVRSVSDGQSDYRNKDKDRVRRTTSGSEHEAKKRKISY
ncbi:putative helicase senataxin [Rhinophrynus dorsalis]